MCRRIAFLALLADATTQASAAPPPVQERHQLPMRSENAQCLIRRHPAFVSAWAATLPGTAAEKKLVRPAESFFTSCFPSWPNAYASTWNYEGIRQRLILELLRPRLASLSDQAPAGLRKTVWFVSDQSGDPGAAAALLANDLGFCVARSDWSSTRILVQANEGAPEEKAALRRLVRLVPGCVPPGQKLTLDAERLRTILTETVFHATSSSAP